MKKIIAILVLLFNVVFLNAQTKPTKQETIDWLTAQIRNHSEYSEKNRNQSAYFSYSIINDSQIEWSKEMFSESKGSVVLTIMFSFNDICDAICYSKEGGITVKFKSSKTVYSDNGISSQVRECYFPMDFSNEVNMQERMLKAFKRLAEYNCQPVKDTF